jgi:hypothetical protein
LTIAPRSAIWHMTNQAIYWRVSAKPFDRRLP